MTGRLAQGRRCATLVVLGWLLLIAAWVVSNPPFVAPDEYEHYVRAIGIGDGHLIGVKDTTARIGATPQQIAWTRKATRLVAVPAGMDPRPFTCATGPGYLWATCLNEARPNPAPSEIATAVGNYPPLPYLLPAVLMRATRSPPGALRIARAAGAGLALALLTLALLALYDPDAPMISIVGLLMAVTPMVLYCASILNGSGLEIAAAIAFASCLLRLLRGCSSRRWWAATAVSGAALVLSRPASPLWLAILLVTVLGASAPSRATLMGAARRRSGQLAAAVLAVAVLLALYWEGRYGSHASADLSQLHAGLVAGARTWWKALPELVGKFGYLDVNLPIELPLLWLAMLAGVVLAGVRGRRAVVTFALLVAAAAVLPPVFYALFTRPTGYGLQGRHLLPALVVLPLLAGEAVYRRRGRLGRRTTMALALGVPIGAALMQGVAWHVNAEYFSGPEAGVWLLGRTVWNPPLGWGPWAATALLGVILLSLAAVVGRRGRQRLAPG